MSLSQFLSCPPSLTHPPCTLQPVAKGKEYQQRFFLAEHIWHTHSGTHTSFSHRTVRCSGLSQCSTCCILLAAFSHIWQQQLVTFGTRTHTHTPFSHLGSTSSHFPTSQSFSHCPISILLIEETKGKPQGKPRDCYPKLRRAAEETKGKPKGNHRETNQLSRETEGNQYLPLKKI